MNPPGNEEVHALSQACSLSDHRSCELSTVIGMAADISEQEGLAPTPQLRHILETRTMTETSALAALREWLDSIPEEHKETGRELLKVVERQ